MKFKMADDKLIFTTVLFAYILNHTTWCVPYLRRHAKLARVIMVCFSVLWWLREEINSFNGIEKLFPDIYVLVHI